MIEEVLYYGYNPSCKRAGLRPEIAEAVSEQKHTEKKPTLIEKGHTALKQSIDKELQRVGVDSTHLVPLSSGLDSRAILSYLLDHSEVDASQIHTVSFGTSGTYDYEIGRQVAKEAGVDNTAIDLTSDSFDWSVDKLQEYAQTRDCPIPMLEGYVNSVAAEVVDVEPTIWSGFLGDPTAGAHQPAEPTGSWADAKDWFIEHNCITTYFARPEFKPARALPPEPYIEPERLSYEEQLDFAHRQQCFIVPTVLSDSRTYATPFTCPEWLSFSLNLPHRHRQDRELFIKIVTKYFPELFSLPTDANNGLPLTAGSIRATFRSIRQQGQRKLSGILSREYTSPKTNYLNFNRAFREGGQLATTIRTLLDRFNQRDVALWVDPMELWRKHKSGQDLAREIRTVCSLELFFQNG